MGSKSWQHPKAQELQGMTVLHECKKCGMLPAGDDASMAAECVMLPQSYLVMFDAPQSLNAIARSKLVMQLKAPN